MIIKSIILKNFQVIENFEADFQNNVYLIKGENELGKSTILKAIGALLTGERDDILKNGADKGFAKMVIGNDGKQYEVELKFTKANPRGTITIKDNNGMKSDNVSMLQKVLKYTDFDAVEFSRWSETAEGKRKQIQVVKSLMPEEIRNRIDEIDKEVISIKDERKSVNQLIKVLTNTADDAKKTIGDIDINDFNEEINLTELLEEQKIHTAEESRYKQAKQAVEERKQQINNSNNRLVELAQNKETRMKMIAEREQKAKEAYEAALASCQNEKTILEVAYKSDVESVNKEIIDLKERLNNANTFITQYESKPSNDIDERIAKAQEHNAKYGIVKNYKEKLAQKEQTEAQAKEMNDKLDALAVERESLINSAELPIEGLTFGEDGLILNGVPFVPGKVSDSQIMEVATKLVIKSNPNVSVFKISRGESLGKNRLNAIVEMAKKYGFQGFIEQVERGQNELVVEEYTEA